MDIIKDAAIVADAVIAKQKMDQLAREQAAEQAESNIQAGLNADGSKK